MTTIDYLPVDVFEDILRYIPKRDLRKNCLYISKSWYESVGSVCYEEVELIPSIIRYFNEKLAVNRSNSDSSFRTIPFTKTLYMYSGGYENTTSTHISPHAFSFVLSLFPNVKELHLGTIGPQRTFNLELLLNYCDPESVLTQLEKITIGHDKDTQEDLYFAAQYKFRKTLKYVRLLHNFDSKHLLSKRIIYEPVLTMLSHFDRLEELVFDNEINPSLTIFSILTTCKTLVSLTFRTVFNVPDQNVNEDFKLMLQAIDPSSPTTYFKNLKKLILTMPYFTKSYMDYFNNYCPETLHQLEVTFQQEDFYNWIEDVSLDKVEKLAERMSKLQIYKISSDQSVPCTKREGVPKNDTKINVFHKVLAAMKGEGRSVSRCVGLYQDTKYPGVSLFFDKTKDYMGYDYYVDHEDYGIDKKDKGEDLVRYQQLPLPDLSLSVGPSMTTETRFMIQVATLHRLPIVQLEHVKKNFTQLNCFQATYLVPMSKMIATQRNTKIRSNIEDMTSCELIGAELSQGLIDGLVPYFPKLQVLKYEIANFFRPQWGLKECIEINLSKLNHLKAFVLDLRDVLYLQNHHTIFFDVCYTDRKEFPAFFTLCGWNINDPEHQSTNYGQFRQTNTDVINQLWGDPYAGVFIVTIELPAVEEPFRLIYSRYSVPLGEVNFTREPALSLDKLTLAET